MAPFRAARSTRSGRTGAQSDFDIVDGLPVRQWRLQEAPVGVEPTVEEQQDANSAAASSAPGKPGAWPELPMPRGSNLYPPWCQQLLRAARAGRLQKRKREIENDEDRDNDANEDHAPNETSKQGFIARRWAQIPRQMEHTEPEYLAPRRAGLPKNQAGYINAMMNGMGDVLPLEMVPDEPVRNRRMPPPRRKPKKGGPGRKKKLAFTEGGGVSAAAEELGEGADGQANEAVDGEDDGEDDDGEEGEDGDEAEEVEAEGAAKQLDKEKMDDAQPTKQEEVASAPAVAPAPASTSDSAGPEITQDITAPPSTLATELPRTENIPPHNEPSAEPSAALPSSKAPIEAAGPPAKPQETERMDIDSAPSESLVEALPLDGPPKDEMEGEVSRTISDDAPQ